MRLALSLLPLGSKLVSAFPEASRSDGWPHEWMHSLGTTRQETGSLQCSTGRHLTEPAAPHLNVKCDLWGHSEGSPDPLHDKNDLACLIRAGPREPVGRMSEGMMSPDHRGQFSHRAGWVLWTHGHPYRSTGNQNQVPLGPMHRTGDGRETLDSIPDGRVALNLPPAPSLGPSKHRPRLPISVLLIAQL